MSQLNLYSSDGKGLGTIDVPPALFDLSPHDGVVYEAVRMIQSNQRQGTASTKNRAAVRGGGRKPWRQKGTGRARAGSRRSPIWVGGGKAFGPIPRDYRFSMPRKKQRLAMRSVLSAKAREGKIIIVDEWTADRPATKGMTERLANFASPGDHCLVLLKERNPNVSLSARNIPTVAVKAARDASLLDVVRADVLIMEQACLAQLEEVLSP
jgi:large subunit ribosomal protein L4